MIIPVDQQAAIADMAARRPDAVRPTVTEQPPALTPHAALLHRTAALMTAEQLPPVYLTVTNESVHVTALPDDRLAENTLRRWAAALNLLINEQSGAMPDGSAGTRWSASGVDDRGFRWSVTGGRPETAVTR